MEQNNPGQMPSSGPQISGTSGISENLANLLCYVGTWITGIIFLLIEKDRPVVRFHAAQSLVLFGGLQILSIILPITFVLAFLLPIIWLVWVILWVFMMYKAYQGGIYKLPLVGDLAEKIAKTNR